MFSDVVVVNGTAELVTDAFFAPDPAWYVRAAAKGGVICAVAQGPDVVLVRDSLSHTRTFPEPAAGVNCTGIRPHALGWEVLYMQGPVGATYARVILDDRLQVIVFRSVPSPYGGTSQGFLDLDVDGLPLMTDQHRSVVLGPLTIFMPTTRDEWTIGQDGSGIRLVGWHAGRQQAYEVWRGGTQTPSHLAIDNAGAAVAVANLPILVHESAFTPWRPWGEPEPVPPPPPLPKPPPPPAPIPVSREKELLMMSNGVFALRAKNFVKSTGLPDRWAYPVEGGFLSVDGKTGEFRPNGMPSPGASESFYWTMGSGVATVDTGGPKGVWKFVVAEGL